MPTIAEANPSVGQTTQPVAEGRVTGYLQRKIVPFGTSPANVNAGVNSRGVVSAAAIPLVGQEITSVTLSRPELVDDASTGEDIKLRNDRKLESRPLTVTMEKELVQQHFDFLTKHLTRWAKFASDADPTGKYANKLEYVLSRPGSTVERNLMKLLSSTVPGPDGKPQNVSIDSEKVAQFLHTEDGWATSLMLMEQSMLYGGFVLGAHTELKKQEFNRARPDRVQGNPAIIEQAYTAPKILAKTGVIGWKSLQAIGYLIAASGNEKLSFKDDADLLKTVKASVTADPSLAVYLEGYTGVDINKVLGVNSYADSYQPAVATLKRDMGSYYRTRKRTLGRLGVDNVPTSLFRGRSIDRSDSIRTVEDHIFNGDGALEDLPVRYLQEMSKIRAEDPRVKNNKKGREWLFASADARVSVLITYTQRLIDSDRASRLEGQEKSAIAAIETKTRMMQTQAETYRKEQREEQDKIKTEAAQKKNEAKTKSDALTMGPEAIATREQAVQGLKDQLIEDFELSLSTSFEKAVEGKISQLEIDIGDALKAYQGAADAGATEARQFAVDDVVKPLAQAVKDLGSGPGFRGTVQLPDMEGTTKPVLEQITTKHAARIEPMKAEWQALTSDLQELRAQFKAYRSAENQLNMAVYTIAAREQDQLASAELAFDTFTGAGGGTLIATDVEVRDETTKDLADRLKTAGVGATDEERLTMVFNAKAEEEARRTKPLPQNQKDALAALLPAGISPDDLLTRPGGRKGIFDTIKDYHVQLNKFNPLHKVPKDDVLQAQVTTAYLGAVQQLRTVYDARLKHEITYYQDVEDTTNKEIDKLKDFKPLIGELTVIVPILKSLTDRGEKNLYSRLSGLVDDRQALDRVGDTTYVDPKDATYSAAEKEEHEDNGVKAQIEKGLIDVYRWVLPDYVSSTDRDKMFGGLVRALPPSKMNELLNIHFNLGLPASPPFVDVASKWQQRVATKSITTIQFQQFAKSVGKYLKERGLAL